MRNVGRQYIHYHLVSLGNCRVSSVEVRKSRSRLKSRGRGFEVEVEVLKSRSRF